GHEAAHLEGAHVVVTSTAVKPDNPEVLEARRLGVPVIPRAEMLAELMRLKYGVAGAGARRQATTPAVVAAALDQGGARRPGAGSIPRWWSGDGSACWARALAWAAASTWSRRPTSPTARS